MKIEIFKHRILPSIKSSFFVLLVLLAYTSTQCKSQEAKEQAHAGTTNKEKNLTIQQDTLKTETYNSDKSMLLKVEKILTPKNPMPTLNYAVYKTGSQEPIKKDSYQGSGVQWHDTTSLELIPYVGIERKPDSENPDEIKAGKPPRGTVIIKLEDSLKKN